MSFKSAVHAESIAKRIYEGLLLHSVIIDLLRPHLLPVFPPPFHTFSLPALAAGLQTFQELMGVEGARGSFRRKLFLHANLHPPLHASWVTTGCQVTIIWEVVGRGWGEACPLINYAHVLQYISRAIKIIGIFRPAHFLPPFHVESPLRKAPLNYAILLEFASAVVIFEMETLSWRVHLLPRSHSSYSWQTNTRTQEVTAERPSRSHPTERVNKYSPVPALPLDKVG